MRHSTVTSIPKVEMLKGFDRNFHTPGLTVEPVRGSCVYKVRMLKHSEHAALPCCNVGRSLYDYFVK